MRGAQGGKGFGFLGGGIHTSRALVVTCRSRSAAALLRGLDPRQLGGARRITTLARGDQLVEIGLQLVLQPSDCATAGRKLDRPAEGALGDLLPNLCFLEPDLLLGFGQAAGYGGGEEVLFIR